VIGDADTDVGVGVAGPASSDASDRIRRKATSPITTSPPIRIGSGAPTREIPRRLRPCGVPQFGQIQARAPGRVW
jgi:hypothetical protein